MPSRPSDPMGTGTDAGDTGRGQGQGQGQGQGAGGTEQPDKSPPHRANRCHPSHIQPSVRAARDHHDETRASVVLTNVGRYRGLTVDTTTHATTAAPRTAQVSNETSR